MTTSTAPLITHCFGRYLMVVPTNFAFAHSYAYKMSDIDIMHSMTPSMFDDVVHKRAKMLGKKTLSNSRRFNILANPMLGDSEKTQWRKYAQRDPSLAPWYREDHPFYIDTLLLTPTQKIIRYYKDGPSYANVPSAGGGKIDGYVLVGKTAYKFSLDTNAIHFDTNAKLMADILARVRTRAPGEIPTEPGFCIDGGFIKGNENVYESVTIAMEPTDQPAVRISFVTYTPSEGIRLPKLKDEIERYFSGSKNGFTTWRRGKRSLNGIEGEEWITRATNDEGNIIHLFTFKSYHGSSVYGDDNRRPVVDIQMSAGGPSNGTASPYTDEEAIKLWDNITNTVRLRPGAF